jgi:hypothetical protein
MTHPHKRPRVDAGGRHHRLPVGGKELGDPLEEAGAQAVGAGQGGEGTVTVASAFPGAAASVAASASVKKAAALPEETPAATFAPGAKPRWDEVPDAPHSMAKIEAAGGGGGGAVGIAQEQS